jgi:hypothetical protein
VKDQYVGDINDYAKYLLLRLACLSFDPVIVAWMLTGGDGKGHGGKIQYLSKLEWRDEDPELFDRLGTLVAEDRCIAGVERAGFLDGCLFASDPIDRSGPERERYFAELERLAGPEALVFFDPDNGLEVSSVPRHRRGAERYLFWEELLRCRDKGASVVVYQHFPRQDRKLYLDRRLARLADELGGDYTVFAAYSSQVAFLFGLRDGKEEPLHSAIEEHCARSRLIRLHTSG